jgi:TonB family protein
LSRRRDIPWGLWAGCLVAAVIAHAVVMVPSGRALARSLAGGFVPKAVEEKVMALDFVEPEPIEPEQFVELDQANDKIPSKTKRVSNRNSDVEHETKAPPGQPSPSSVAGMQPGQPAKPADPVEAKQEGDSSDNLVEAADGSQAGAKSPTQVAQEWGKLGGSPGMLHDSFGTAGRPDNVPKVEPQHQNLLDSKEHLYASFFSRMRGRILEHWNAQKAIDRYDPRGTALGSVPRTTVVLIRLNSSGAIDKLTVTDDSDVAYLDQEAIRALKAAGPFPNPPAGLFENGVFEITVAFTVQPDGSARVFRSGR